MISQYNIKNIPLSEAIKLWEKGVTIYKTVLHGLYWVECFGRPEYEPGEMYGKQWT